jgi:phage gp29-like protein
MDKVIYNTITIRQPARTASEAGTWRAALRAADMGRVKALYDLYDDLLIDTVLHRNWNKRIESVLNAEVIFQMADKKQNERVNNLLESTGWDNLITGLMNAKGYGRFAVECDFSNGFDCHIIPPKHVSLQTHSILINDTDYSGIDYLSHPNIIAGGDWREFGLFLRTAPFAIWKRGGFGDYAQWLEIFGMPQRIGKYSAYDPASRLALEEAFKVAGSAPWLVIPKESEVETVNNTGTGSSGTSFNEFRKACNEEMLVCIVGNTLTSISGENGARSLGEVHRDVEESIFKSDMRYISKMLNSLFLPILEARGFGAAGGKFVFPDNVEPLTVPDIVSLSSIIPIPASFLRDKYGIPAPEAGEEIAGQKQAEPEEPKPVDTRRATSQKQESFSPPSSNGEGGENDGDGYVRKGRGLFAFLSDFFGQAPRGGATQKWWKRLTGNSTGIQLADGINIDELFRQAVREVYGSRGEELINRKLFQITNKPFQQAVEMAFKDVNDPLFVSKFRNSCAEFAAFKNHVQTKEFADALYDENGALRPFYKFKQACEKIGEKFNDEWLRTEYNTLVRSLSIAKSLKNYEKTLSSYPNLEYMHTRAAHPDPLHERYVGTVLPFNHPAWLWLMPPSRWNCLCSVRPTKLPPTEAPEKPDDFDPIFDNNSYITGEFINIRQSPYYKHTPKNVRQQVRDFAKEMVKIDTSGAKVTRQWAKENIQGASITHPVFDREIKISGGGIREFTNQPHSLYFEKNELLKNLQSLFNEKTTVYRGVTNENGRTFHIFEIILMGKKNYIIANENSAGEIYLYSIAESDKVLNNIVKP